MPITCSLFRQATWAYKFHNGSYTDDNQLKMIDHCTFYSDIHISSQKPNWGTDKLINKCSILTVEYHSLGLSLFYNTCRVCKHRVYLFKLILRY